MSDESVEKVCHSRSMGPNPMTELFLYAVILAFGPLVGVLAAWYGKPPDRRDHEVLMWVSWILWIAIPGALILNVV